MKIRNGVVIKIARGTRDRLKNMGRKGQTYDEIINIALDCLEKEGESSK